MHARTRIPLLLIIVAFGVLSPVLTTPALAVDERDPEEDEWEDVVAVDARGDVLIHWSGTIDLLYLTTGELYSYQLQQTYIFFRVGYNLTGPNDGTYRDRDTKGIAQELDLMPEDDPRFLALNITFRVEGERRTLNLFSNSLGQGWQSDQGQLVLSEADKNGHSEVVFFAPITRFGLRPGMVMMDINTSAVRDGRLTDRMSGFDAVEEYPVPTRISGLLGDRDLAIPYGVSRPKEHVDWAHTETDRVRAGGSPDLESNPTLDTNASRVMEDPHSGQAEQKRHLVKSGREVINVRADKESVNAGTNRVGFVNFTVENTMRETNQLVFMGMVRPRGTGWAFNYGPGTTAIVQELLPEDRAEYQFVAYPTTRQALPYVLTHLIVLSNGGGFEVFLVPWIFEDKYDLRRPLPDLGPSEPTRLVATLLNPDDPFRINEPREVLIQVRDTSGAYVTGMEEMRVFVHPFGEPRPDKPHAAPAKPFMPGVYKVPYVFDKTGAWVIDVHFFDLGANADGVVPSIDFKVRVHYGRESPEIVPLPLALGGVGLGLVGLVVKDRLSKIR
ncbi:MAG: hypothetical protein KY455_10490 [Euryarchaeota archaeon]|nr:hypothetical protein [Euryarchaeota archaeon]